MLASKNVLINLINNISNAMEAIKVKFNGFCFTQSSEILPQMIIPHGSYLLNCGSANEEILKKSRDCLIDELKRCELLGIPMYNFHPG